MFGFRIGAATDVGEKRQANQDSYATSASIVIVADGMGGHRGGEVASSIAASEVIERFNAPRIEVLADGVRAANERIIEDSTADPNLHGMGTTVVALAFIELHDGVALGAVNVGDSRMYRLTGSVLEQLTEDHSLVEALVREGRITAAEAEVHPQRNILTRALGVSDRIEVDTFNFIPRIGDRYLLCSDGLFNEVAAQRIAQIMSEQPDPQTAAEELIQAANQGGGRDNITAVIADIVSEDDAVSATQPNQMAAQQVSDFDAPGQAPRRWTWRS